MMNFICKMDGEPATWPCPSPGCPLFGDCLSEREGNSKPPMTNADRIRAMSDEELAEFLAEEQYRIANVIFQAAGYGLEKQAIYARRLDWLQQPAKEDT